MGRGLNLKHKGGVMPPKDKEKGSGELKTGVSCPGG